MNKRGGMLYLPWAHVERLIARASAEGAPRFRRKSLATFELDRHGRCDNPVLVTIVGRPSPDNRRPRFDGAAFRRRMSAALYAACEQVDPETGEVVYGDDPLSAAEILLIASGIRRDMLGSPRTVRLKRGETKSSLFLDLWVRCRKCAQCRYMRARLWRERAKAELMALKPFCRCWFATLTLDPSGHSHAWSVARAYAQNAKGEDFDKYEEPARIREFMNVRRGHIGREVDLWLRRLRKGKAGKYPGARFRYLLVTELHRGGGQNDGNVHVHLLMYETDPDHLLKKHHAEEQWPWIIQFKLVDMSNVWQVGYVCKYISKDLNSVVRASKGFGRSSEAVAAEFGTTGVEP